MGAGSLSKLRIQKTSGLEKFYILYLHKIILSILNDQNIDPSVPIRGEKGIFLIPFGA
jgi:hypothetical protein